MISYLFGVIGSLRVSSESKVPYSNEGFLSTGSATTAFRSSAVPEEFFWTYVYTTSALANLQVNVSVSAPGDIGAMSLAQWFNNEVLPDLFPSASTITPELRNRKLRRFLVHSMLPPCIPRVIAMRDGGVLFL